MIEQKEREENPFRIKRRIFTNLQSMRIICVRDESPSKDNGKLRLSGISSLSLFLEKCREEISPGRALHQS